MLHVAIALRLEAADQLMPSCCAAGVGRYQKSMIATSGLFSR